MNNFLFLIPEIFLISVLLIIIFFIPFLSNRIVYKYINLINFIEIFLVINLFMYIYLNLNSWIYNEHIIFNNIFVNNNFSVFFKILISSISILIIISIKEHINIVFKNNNDFYIIFLFLFISLTFLIMCFDLIYAALFIQMQNLTFYIFLALNNKVNRSLESALKYFFLSSVAFGIYMFGVSIIYFCLGTTKLNEIFYLTIYNNLHQIHINLLLISFILIILSFFFILSVAPFHFWAPDVYLGMDRSVLIIFSIIPKLSLLFFFYKLYLYIFKNFFFPWEQFFIFFIFLTFLIGFFGAVYSKNIQNLFAFFWIFTVGFLLIFFVLDINTFFYLFIFLYGINIFFFCICILLFKEEINNYKELSLINQVFFLKKINFIFFICIIVSIFALLGLPPLSGFIGKFFIFISMLQEKYYLLIFFIFFFTIISCFYYLKLIKILSFNNNNKWFFFKKIDKKKSYILSFFLIYNLFSFFLMPFFVEFFKFLYLSSLFFL